VLGALGVLAYAWLASQLVIIPWEGVGAGIGAAVLVGVLASSYPAAKAASLPPSDVLRMVP
jgi:ABC-type lipoprotein release transport system permease subunit